MAEKEQVIFEINVDLGQSDEQVQNLTKNINSLTGEQKQLRDEIKKNGDEQGVYSKRLEENRTKTAELKKERKDMITVLKANSKSIDQVRAANKLLNKERNSLNLSTEQGRKRLTELNKKLDENNKFIKDNSDAYAKQKIGIGGYTDSIKEALPGMTSMAAGFKQMTLQALKFIATPIGAVLTVIVVALKALSAAFTRNIRNQEQLNKITAVFSGALNTLLDALQPVIEFMLDVAIRVISDFAKGISFVVEQLEKFGILAEGTTKSLEEMTAASQELADSERRLIESQIELEKQQLRFQTQAEKLRQIRDDESRSMQERIAANNRLGALLTEQQNAERKLAEERLRIANLNQKVNGENLSSIQAIGDAEIKLIEIEERITSQRSEQLVNTNSLLRERFDLEQALFDQKLKEFETQSELDQAEIDAQTAIDDELLELEEEFQEEKLEIQTAAASERWKREQETEKAIVELRRQMLQAGVQIAKNIFDKAQDDRIAKINDNVAAEEAILKKRLENGEITEQEFSDRVQQIKKEARIEEAKAEKKKSLFDIVIATAVGIVKALAALNPALAGIIAATGLVQAGVVLAEPLPTLAEGGGIFGGKLHSQGGVRLSADGVPIAEVERDEGFFVMKRSATNELMERSALNEKHGGNSFFGTPTRFLQEGGEVQTTDLSNIISAIQKLNIFVTVTDIQNGLGTQAKVTDRAII